MTPEGSITTLYSFCAQTQCSDGADPFAGLLQATNGIFYGTTTSGGGAGQPGTVYSESTGLKPFVSFLPPASKPGQEVGILGNSLTGATSVTFNGTPAQFSVRLPTLILTHVPAGATTGKIKVTLPNGTLTSNVSFVVR